MHLGPTDSNFSVIPIWPLAIALVHLGATELCESLKPKVNLSETLASRSHQNTSRSNRSGMQGLCSVLRCHRDYQLGPSEMHPVKT